MANVKPNLESAAGKRQNHQMNYYRKCFSARFTDFVVFPHAIHVGELVAKFHVKDKRRLSDFG